MSTTAPITPQGMTTVPQKRSGKTLAGYAALALGAVACPCHLPLTLGLVAALFGGSTVAALTTGGALFIGATAVFVVSVALGVWLLKSRAPATAGGIR